MKASNIQILIFFYCYFFHDKKVTKKSRRFTKSFAGLFAHPTLAGLTCCDLIRVLILFARLKLNAFAQNRHSPRALLIYFSIFSTQL
jgi:hypothetical protein